MRGKARTGARRREDSWKTVPCDHLIPSSTHADETVDTSQILSMKASGVHLLFHDLRDPASPPVSGSRSV